VSVEPERCLWHLGHPAMVAYHDREWGVPLHDGRRQFKFLGPTTVYANLQAAGPVNDHLVGCFRHGAVGA
jgi:3-methyladenine DNA glycosylase Tag